MVVRTVGRRSGQGASSEIEGLLIVDKDSGWTSHDVVAKLRGVLGVRKIGHTGTLDPLATGLLLLCVGRATKAARFLVGLEKAYLATMRVGGESDTLDATGHIVLRPQQPAVSQPDIEKVLGQFLGPISQIPPMYSAVKHKGQRLYRLARRGQTVPRPPRTVHIRALSIDRFCLPEVDIRVVCSSGTYVRSLVADIGRQLGCGAYLKALRRTRLGPFRVEDAVSVAKAVEMAERGHLAEHLIPLARGLQGYRRLVVYCQDRSGVRNGRSILRESVRMLDPGICGDDVVRIEDSEGHLMGMAQLLIGDKDLNEISPTQPVCRYLRVLS